MLTPGLWAVYALWVVFQAYSEGYRGFQLRFCPRVMARAVHLGRHPRPLHLLLAPLFLLSLIHAPRRRLIVRYVFLAALILLIALVRQLPQPWIGIIDGGVVLGLGWGVIVLWWLLGRYLLGYGSPDPIDLPESESETETTPGDPATGDDESASAAQVFGSGLKKVTSLRRQRRRDASARSPSSETRWGPSNS